jgi:ATP-dependent HslUV protease, peptidase subunit HslV
MSVVVAVQKGGRVALAADTQTSFGDTRIPSDNLRARKISKVGNAFVGKTGWGIYENIFTDFLGTRRRTPDLGNERAIYSFFLGLWRELHEKYGFVNDQCHEKDSPFADLDATFLVVNRNGIHHVASDMSVTRFEKFFAIGAGCDFALGALCVLYDEDYDAAALARKAVEAAMTYKVYCGGDIDLVEVKTGRRRANR